MNGADDSGVASDRYVEIFIVLGYSEEHHCVFRNELSSGYHPSPPTWAERPDFVLNALVAKKEMPDRRTLHTMVE